MAIVATAAGETSNSYIDLATAKTMAASAGAGMAAFLAKTDEEINAALIRAALDVDAHRFHHPEPYATTQALAFPRYVDVGVILNHVKWAQLYQAEFIAVSGEYDRKQWEGGAAAAPMQTAGVGSPLCPRAMTMIQKYISRVGSYGSN